MARQHRLDPTPETVHWGYFDAKLPSRIEIDSGDTVVVDTVSGFPEVAPDEALYRPEHREIVTRLKPILGGHILTGPVAVRGAQPGHTLEVRIKAIELTADWGWNVIRPLRGTLPEDFPNFERRTLPLDRKKMTATLPWGPTIPLQPSSASSPRRRGPSTAASRRLSRASSAATSIARSMSQAARCSCRCSCRVRISHAATATRCRAMARCAWRRSRPASRA